MNTFKGRNRTGFTEDECLFIVYGAKLCKKRIIDWQAVFMKFKNRFQSVQTIHHLRMKYDRLKSSQKTLLNYYQKLVEKHSRLIEDFVSQNKHMGTVVQALGRLGKDSETIVDSIRGKNKYYADLVNQVMFFSTKTNSTACIGNYMFHKKPYFTRPTL